VTPGRALPLAVGPILAALAVGAWTAAFRGYGVFDFADEGTLLAQALRTAHGQRPYLDFHTGYGPLYFALQGALVAAGGLAAVRWALIVTHALTAAAVWTVTQRLAGGAVACAAIALEVALFLPVAPDAGAPFLVPYPSWYAALLGVAVLLAVERRAGPVGVARAALAGVLAGVAFGVKANSGLLIAGGAAAALVLGPTVTTAPGVLARVTLGLLGAGVIAIVMPPVTTVAWWVLVPPVLGLLLVVGRRAVPDVEAAPRLAALVVGFAVVVGVTFGPSLAALGPSRFLREVLLVGSGVADVYAVPFPRAAFAGVVAGVLALRVPVDAAVGRLVGGAVVTVVLAAIEGALGGQGMAALRLGAEMAVLALVPLVAWAGIVMLRRAGDARAVAPVTLAVTAAVQLYPRPDFLHLLAVAPVLLPLGLHVARTGARGWLPRARATAVVVTVALVLATVRVAPTLRVLALAPWTHVRVGDVTLGVTAGGADRLRALGAAVQAVRDHGDETVRVVTFPACAVVPFFAGRLPAGPHDYFFPGRPDADEVAALARTFAAAPPPLAVTCDAAGTDLAVAWTQHGAMVSFLAERYRPVAAMPPFHVLEAIP
jgi:hypothetical protein